MKNFLYIFLFICNFIFAAESVEITPDLCRCCVCSYFDGNTQQRFCKGHIVTWVTLMIQQSCMQSQGLDDFLIALTEGPITLRCPQYCECNHDKIPHSKIECWCTVGTYITPRKRKEKHYNKYQDITSAIATQIAEQDQTLSESLRLFVTLA